MPFHAFELSTAGGALVAAASLRVEADLVGLYDIFTRPRSVGTRAIAARCASSCSRSREVGARNTPICRWMPTNDAGRAMSTGALGFADAYAYHYRATSAPG